MLRSKADESNATMTVRRRSRRGPLTEFASRSPMHAFLVWLVRTSLLVLIGVGAYLIIMNLLVPNMIDGLVQQVQNRSQ